MEQSVDSEKYPGGRYTIGELNYRGETISYIQVDYRGWHLSGMHYTGANPTPEQVRELGDQRVGGDVPGQFCVPSPHPLDMFYPAWENTTGLNIPRFDRRTGKYLSVTNDYGA